MAANEYHSVQLTKHCRVCSQLLKPNSHYFACNSVAKEFWDAINVNVAKDSAELHPPSVCINCYSKMKKRAKECCMSTLEVYNWQPHMEPECPVCEHFATQSKGGRPKKERKNRGRRRTTVLKKALDGLHQSVPPPWKAPHQLEIAHFLTPSAGIALEDLQCKACACIVERPVQTICGKLLCLQCLEQYWQNKDSDPSAYPCPCCDDGSHESAPTVAADVVHKIVGSLLMHCTACREVVQLGALNSHLESGCTLSSAPSPSKLTMGQILSRPADAPPTATEQRVATSVVKRLLNTSPSASGSSSAAVVSLPTAGQPLSLVRISRARVATPDVSKTTKRRRSAQLTDMREAISGGVEAAREQLKEDLERQRLISDSAFTVELSTEESLAMKANLSLPWRKLRIMRRWFKAHGVVIPSEKRLRQLSDDILGNHLESGTAPFTFALKHGGEDLRPAPLVYVPDLSALVFQYLDQNERVQRLTWHDGLIPQDEVWVKVGGDKGGPSFKMSFQLANTPNPNSVENTCVFAVFEAKDSLTNLQVALERYRPQISALQSASWQGKKIRVFLFGDYEYMGKMYGISGASGRHCCLYCTVTSEAMRTPLKERGRAPLRSLDTLARDHLKFETIGKGNLKNAKHYNNVIGKAFFDIPLSQACLPGLHISLGVFMKLWGIMESECHKLDLELALLSSGMEGDRAGFLKYTRLIEEVHDLTDEKHRLTQFATMLDGAVTSIALQLEDDDEQNPRLLELRQEAVQAREQIESIENNITEKREACKGGFEMDDGPFCIALDKALGSFDVYRQAYYGGTFNGNQAHKCLQEVNITALCLSITTTADSRCAELLDKARAVAEKFKTAFLLFASCHRVYSGRELLSESDLDSLETKIEEFLAYYRASFPQASITPKLHMIEDHVVDFLRQWRVGFGFLGEQGAESIHITFNELHRTYGNMRNGADRLRQVMLEHHRKTCPLLNSQRPQPQQRR